MKQYIFLFLIIVLSVGIPLLFNILKKKEGYSNYTLDKAFGQYPNAQTTVLVQDTYPFIGKNQLSDNTSNDIWKEYPIFKLGSYEQITNNIRYPDNPDDGTCMPASMCGALYRNKNIHTNLPPVKIDGTRINYYNTDVNLLPFRTNITNILY
jgi:hypothetical protein